MTQMTESVTVKTVQGNKSKRKTRTFASSKEQILSRNLIKAVKMIIKEFNLQLSEFNQSLIQLLVKTSSKQAM